MPTQNHESESKRRGSTAYLVGRLATMNTQRNSFKGREGFAIAVEHLEAECGEAIITIFDSSLLQMDVSVYSLCSFSTTHYARWRQRVCKSRPEADVRWREISQSKIDASRKLGFVSLVYLLCACRQTSKAFKTATDGEAPPVISYSSIEQLTKAVEPESGCRLTPGSERN